MASTPGLPTSEELSRWLLVWLTFLGAIVALRQHAHLGVDTLVRALPPLGKKICFIASYVLMLYADWLLTLGSWKQAVLTFGDSAPASGISVGLFFYSSGLVFGVSAGGDPAARSRPRAERPGQRGRPDLGEGRRMSTPNALRRGAT